jgi:hypothetical protein
MGKAPGWRDMVSRQQPSHADAVFNPISEPLIKRDGWGVGGNSRIDPSKRLMRPAGEIARVPGNNTVFINLGEGQELTLGMTFEVYDRRTGIPPLTQANSPVPELTPGQCRWRGSNKAWTS